MKFTEVDGKEKIEYYNEYVLIPEKSFWGIIVYILYLPVNIICFFVFKDFHKIEKQTPNQLAYHTVACLIILLILSFLLAYLSALIAIS